MLKCTDSILAIWLYLRYPNGEITVLPEPIAGFKGPTSKGREKKKRRLCSSNFFKYALAMADPMLFLKRGKTIYQPRPHLSQMHTAIYELFTWKKAAFWEKNEPIGGKPPRFESATVHWGFMPLPNPIPWLWSAVGSSDRL